jgi:serine protease
MSRNRTVTTHRFHFLLAAFAVFSNTTQARAEIGSAPFRINTDIPGNQSLSDVSMSGSGEWVAIFREELDNSNFARRYDAAGRPLLPTSFSVLGQYAALDWLGKFVAVRFAPDGSSNGIFSTLYDPFGIALGSEQRVHASINGNQAGPGVASNANGDSVVIWLSGGRVYARRFAPDGAAVSAEVDVAEGYPVGVRVDYWGNFVVAYLRLDATQPLLNVWARSYTASGAAGAETRLTASPRAIHNGAKLAMNETGDCVVVWDVRERDAVYGQRFALGGALTGGTFQVQPRQDGLTRIAPDVGVALDGSFAVVYIEYSAAGPRVMKRAFGSDGVPVGVPALVARSDATATSWPRIAMDRDGGHAVAWTRSDASGQRDAYAQRFLPEGVPVSPLRNGSSLFPLSGAEGSWLFYRLSVPPGMTALDVSIRSTSGAGDADLYLRYGALPSLSSWDASPYLDGSNETAAWSAPAAGDWFIGVNAFSSYSGVTLQASYR